jgi:predicted dehydrogenase
MIRLAQADVGMLVVDEDGARGLDVYYAPEVHGRLRGALAIEVDHFVECARGAAEPACTAEDGTEAVRISLAMEASADRGTPVALATAPTNSWTSFRRGE